MSFFIHLVEIFFKTLKASLLVTSSLSLHVIISKSAVKDFWSFVCSHLMDQRTNKSCVVTLSFPNNLLDAMLNFQTVIKFFYYNQLVTK